MRILINKGCPKTFSNLTAYFRQTHGSHSNQSKACCVFCTMWWLQERISGSERRQFCTRLKEHESPAVSYLYSSKSALAKQVCQTCHKIAWEDSRIITTDNCYMYRQRLWLETWHINTSSCALNRHDCSYLPQEYLHLVFKWHHVGQKVNKDLSFQYQIIPDEDTPTGVSKSWVVGTIFVWLSHNFIKLNQCGSKLCWIMYLVQLVAI